MTLFPKEHGAYGQASFPILTAFAVAGVTVAGVAIAIATIAGFLAHEPATVLRGLRGARAQHALRVEAARWLAACGVAGIPAAVAALVLMPAAERWSLAVPVVPALLLALAWFKGREKSWYGEMAAALAFSAVAIPVTLAAGAPFSTALTAAVPFALLFISGTLAVRVVILRVRGGGDPHAMRITRRAAFAVVAIATFVLGVMAGAGIVPAAVLVAAAPGLAVSAFVAAFPPPPARLRMLGWTLVGSSVITFGLIVAVAS